MALPTGTITMNDVNIELGRPSGSQITLNDADVRSLAGRPSGTISMDDLRGKSVGPRGYWYVLFSPSLNRRALFELNFSGAPPNSPWRLELFPSTNTFSSYPANWTGDFGFNGFSNSAGNIFTNVSNNNDTQFWWPAVKANLFDIYINNELIGGVQVTNTSNTSTNGGFWFDNRSTPSRQWSSNVIPQTSSNGTTSPNLCNIYWRRRVLRWVYTSAEMSSALGRSSATIFGMRFFVTQRPIYEPLPGYVVGMKQGNFSVGSNPGATGFTIVSSVRSPGFLSNAFKYIAFDNPFAWNGQAVVITCAWAQVQPTWNSSGVSGIGSGTMFHAQTDSAGSYTVSSGTNATVSYRPVVQFLSSV